MLELQRFLLRRISEPPGPGRAYEILDPDTEQRAGFARENPGAVVRRLRQFLSPRFLPTRTEVREIEDESLVFIVSRTIGLLGQEIEVADADEQLVGYLRLRSWSRRGNSSIYDQDSSLFAELQGNWSTMNFIMIGPDGSKLGAVTNVSVNQGPHTTNAGSGFLVALDEFLADQPFAKMLILGSALGLDLAYR
jgi:hypothetical protein